MEQRRLGASDIMVGELGLGCMGMTGAYGSPADWDEAASIEVIRRAMDLGVTMIDTAELYGPWVNEKLVGKAIAGRRDEVTIATKTGLVSVDPELGLNHVDCRPMHIKLAVDASLYRLGVDVIDLYYLHRPDPTVPIAESVGAMAELVQAGKVRHIGVSEYSVQQLEQAVAVHPIVAVQSEMSLWTRDALAGVLPWCEANDAAFVPFSPLGRGFLTGTVATTFDARDMRSRHPRFQPEARDANDLIVARIRTVAERLGASPAQVAIAWTLAQGAQVIPIPGTKRLKYLEENLAAADLVLSADDLAELDDLPEAVGHRSNMPQFLGAR
ncbi:aldo/keto reductase [Nakamurella alba]